MTCATCACVATRGDHVYCANVGACVCRYVATDAAPSWCPGWRACEADAKRCADAAVDAVTVALHTGEM